MGCRVDVGSLPSSDGQLICFCSTQTPLPEPSPLRELTLVSTADTNAQTKCEKESSFLPGLLFSI